MARSYSALSALSLALAFLAFGCSGGGSNGTRSPDDDTPPGTQLPGDGATDFVSYLPGGDGSRGGDLSAESGDSAGTPSSGAGATGNVASDGGGNGAERAITEADVIQRDGDTLYALSRHTGLTLIDLSTPTDLKVLGRHGSDANPFEMYREGSVAVILENNWSRYRYDEATQQTRWYQASQVEIVDTATPGAIRVLGALEVPGTISDSRKVGDVLYLVTTEHGDCWGCHDSGAATVVTSFNVANPQQITQVDQLRFEQDGYLGDRSIAVTQERIYMAGWTWSESGQESGDIQVVDISDPAGKVVAGALVPIAGQIQNRWQMDEHDGVLRIISQPGRWGSEAPPVVETFSVANAQTVTALGSLTMTLPRPESLRSVRFDGDRAYAITFERTDPLFTIDLRDPAAPKQAGELEIPGWVYHMEPRGDRVYGVGFDQNVDGGALHLSLFDVSDLSTPTMLDRVNFGGDWASFAEDQDRIHKSVQLLGDEGLALIPFSGWDDGDANDCRGTYNSGIQLVDFTADDLTLRGVAPQVGEARRAFLHRDHLFGISDNAVQSFDVSNKDAPKRQDMVEVARNISTVRALESGQVMRFGNDWWTARTVLDVGPVSNVTRPDPVNALDLSGLLPEGSCEDYAYWGAAHVHGEVAYVERRTFNYGAAGEPGQTLSLVVVDLGAQPPKVLRTVDVTTSRRGTSSGGGSYESLGGIVVTDNALLVGRVTQDYASTGRWTTQQSYDIYDLTDPTSPTFTTNFAMPDAVNHYWGMPVMGCAVDMAWGWWGYGGGYYGGAGGQALVSGDVVASQHFEAIDEAEDPNRGRFFLDRLDVSDPSAPKLLEPINIPGQVVHYDDADGQLTTISTSTTKVGASEDACWSSDVPSQYWDYQTERCVKQQRQVNVLTLEGTRARRIGALELDRGWYASSIAVSDDRIFVQEFEVDAGRDERSVTAGRVRAFAGTASGLFAVSTFETEPAPHYWGGGLVARGRRAFQSTDGALRVFDATDGKGQTSEHELASWGCHNIEVRGDDVFCALGERGVEHISLN